MIRRGRFFVRLGRKFRMGLCRRTRELSLERLGSTSVRDNSGFAGLVSYWHRESLRPRTSFAAFTTFWSRTLQFLSIQILGCGSPKRYRVLESVCNGLKYPIPPCATTPWARCFSASGPAERLSLLDHLQCADTLSLSSRSTTFISCYHFSRRRTCTGAPSHYTQPCRDETAPKSRHNVQLN
jgi:hypothetical protein